MSQHVFNFETGIASDPGRVREVNEDNSFAAEEEGIWVVADGMGGHAQRETRQRQDRRSRGNHWQGRVRSRPAGPVSRPHAPHQSRNSGLSAARNRRGHGGYRRGGVDLRQSLRLRLVRRQPGLSCARRRPSPSSSRDHTEAQGMVDRGLLTERGSAQLAASQRASPGPLACSTILNSRSLHGKVLAGDRFVLCSDGLTGHVADDEICDIVENFAPQDACDRLVGLTL